MKTVNFMGWKNCVELKSGNFRIIVTTEMGPRIIGGFLGKSANLFYVNPETAGKTGSSEWLLYGGHRLWHSPEIKPRTYAPDNAPVTVKEMKEGIIFCSGTEKSTGIHKSIRIKSLGNRKFKVSHKLRNDNLWDVELAAWALSVMAPGGMAIIPQPQGDKKALLPNRYLTIWPYTNMADPRITWGEKFTFLRHDAKAKIPCKLGLNCENGWISYVNKGVGLVKRFQHLIDAEYPDNGCSIESYSCSFMLEIETLSPLYQLAPGAEITHVEEWEGIEGFGEIKTEADAVKYFK